MPVNNNAIGARSTLIHSPAAQDAQAVDRSSASLDPSSEARSPSMLARASSTLPPAPSASAAAASGTASSAHGQGADGVHDSSSTQTLTGVESTAAGLKKATEAGVNVARRTFWAKFFNTALVAIGLAVVAAATGGVGALAIAAIATTGAYMTKSWCDTILSLVNWQNMKQELQGKPPRWPELAALPASVRTDSLASLLMAAGMSEKKALLTSRSTELSLGLTAAATSGFLFKGLWGAVGAVGAAVGGAAIQAFSDSRMARRQQHVEEVAVRTRAAYDEAAGQFLAFSTRINKDIVEALAQADPLAAKKLDDQYTALLKFQMEAAEDLDRQANGGGELTRLETKAQKGIDGVGAVVSDALSGQVASGVDSTLSPLPHAAVVVTKLARAGVEQLRTMRSESRDVAKEAKVNDLLLSIKEKMTTLEAGIKAEIDKLQQPLAPRPMGAVYA
jgi:hypothetical protein